MQDGRTEQVFRDAPVWKAVLNNALPAMAAMLMVLIYNLADTFFIGQTGDDLQVAAVSLATPVFLLFMSVGTIFGIGGTSVISRALGRGEREYAKKVSSFCMWACVITGLAMTALMLAGMDPLLRAIGASEDTWTYTKTYLVIVSCCGPFVLIANCYSNVVRAEGRSGTAMMGQLIGNLLNVVLDPVMILGFGWGIRGAAIATVIGNVAGAAWYIGYFLTGKSSLSVRWRDFTVRNGVCSGVLAIGIPASLGSFLMSISNILTNALMAGYGDLAVAAIGVAMKVTMITGLICIGLGQGVQPLLGYCAGAGLWERFRRVLRYSLRFAFLLSLSMTLLCYLFIGPLVGAFLTEPEAYDFSVRFSRILLSTSALFGVYYVLCNVLQAVGAAKEALVINLSRQGLIYIPALYLLNALLGAAGIAWAQPVADVLSTVFVAVLCRRTLRRAGETQQAAAADVQTV